MVDAFNTEVNVGDKVLYIRKYADKVSLAKGTIMSIKGRIARVRGASFGVMSQSIFKLGEGSTKK